MTFTIPSHLSDDDLMAAVPRLAGDERESLARLVAHLSEVDRRGLYVAAGYSCLYAYCHEGLGYSEGEAYNRKTAGQLARRYPAVVQMLADGQLSLTAVRLLAPVVDDTNWQAAFDAAAGLAKREVEKLVARLQPKPDVPSTVRKLSAPRASRLEATPSAAEAGTPAPEKSPSTAPASPSVLAPRPIVAALAPERYRVQFTIGEATEKKLRRLQQLLRREIPDGDPAVIFDRALDLLLAKTENRKEGARSDTAGKRCNRKGRPLAPGSRRVPASTRRVVAPRDDRRCTFVAMDGRRCTARVYLEYHHAGVPFACGGGPGAENIALLCRARNAYEGRRVFGDYVPREIREARAEYEAMLAAEAVRDAGGNSGRSGTA